MRMSKRGPGLTRPFFYLHHGVMAEPKTQTPPQTRGEKNLAQIRERGTTAAEKIVVEEGVAALAARRLAKELGVSVGTLYNAFHDIDGVVRAVNNRSAQLLTKRLVEAVEGAAPDRRSRLIAMGEAYFDFAMDEPERWWTLFEYRMDSRTDEVAEEHQRTLLELLIRTAGSEPETDPAPERYLLLWASVHGLVALARRPTIVAVPPEAARRYLVEVIDAGLAMMRLARRDGGKDQTSDK